MNAVVQIEAVNALYRGQPNMPQVYLLTDTGSGHSVPQHAYALGRHVAIELGRCSQSPWHSRLKRVIDLVVAVPAFVLALPFIAICAAIIKLADPGKALFVQDRIGRNGCKVPIPKLRTMYTDAEERLARHLRDSAAAHLEWDRYMKLSDDPRILAGAGKFIRRFSLDELPQLWSVIRGDLSLVGPRPFPAYHVERFDKEFQLLRSSVTPGLTGLWQVTARSNGDLKAQKALDQFYIHNRSMWLDLYILLQTVPAVFGGRGAR